MKSKSTSEFGKGLCYNLGLFLAHAEREIQSSKEGMSVALWFNGAGDHLFDLVIPPDFPKELRDRLIKFQGRVLSNRNSFFDIELPKSEQTECLQEAKDLLRAIDNFHGIKTEEGEWE